MPDEITIVADSPKARRFWTRLVDVLIDPRSHDSAVYRQTETALLYMKKYMTEGLQQHARPTLQIYPHRRGVLYRETKHVSESFEDRILERTKDRITGGIFTTYGVETEVRAREGTKIVMAIDRGRFGYTGWQKLVVWEDPREEDPNKRLKVKRSVGPASGKNFIQPALVQTCDVLVKRWGEVWREGFRKYIGK